MTDTRARRPIRRVLAPEMEPLEPIDARLVNPFLGDDAEEMREKIASFLAVSNIDSIYHPLITKGAWLAQDERSLDKENADGPSLDQNERATLRAEVENKWTQPVILYALVACCSLGAMVQGWDETAVNQAQIFYIEYLGVGGSFEQPSFLLGLLNSAPYLAAALVGCWLTDPMNYYLGRRGTIFWSCFICSITCLAQALTNNWWGMFLARLALGLGMGPKSATVPIYAAECAPKRIRGALVMMWQTWTAFGIMLGYVAGVVFGNVEDPLRWRLIIGSPMVLPLIVMAYVYILPESPRWRLHKGRTQKGGLPTQHFSKAFEGLTKLRGSRLLAARDMFLIYYSLEAEDKVKAQHNRFLQMFTVPRNRRALRAGIIVMFFQQFCGVNVLAYYSSLIFQKAGFYAHEALICSLGFGIINFLFALPAVPIIDTFGRRNLLLATFPIMAGFQLFTGLAFYGRGEVRKALVTTGMYLFSVAYSPGEGPVPFTYCSECMPLYVREIAMSLFTATLWFFNFVLSITFPPFLQSFKEIGTFVYYAAWCMVGFVCILVFVPETGNQTLEELDARFSLPSKKLAKFGYKQLLYFFWHTLFRQPMAKPRDIEIKDIPVRLPAKIRRTSQVVGPRKIPLDPEIERVSSVAEEFERDV